jgi:hypothetical protein
VATAKAQIERESQPAYFLRALYPDSPLPGFLILWDLPSKLSSSYKYPVFAAKKAQELARDHDVYFGLGLQAESLPADRRGESKHVVAIPGLWIDIDIAGPNHKAVNLPKTREEALEFLHSLPWQPSLIVFSGGGIHAYHLFKELWCFDSDQERARAQELSRRFQAYIIAEGTSRGWKIDNTSNLAQVLRVPGSYNRKQPDNPVLVEVIQDFPDRRYSPADFEEFLPKKETSEAKPRIEPESRLIGAEEGERNNTIFRMVCSWRSSNLTEREIKILAHAQNNNCASPLSVREVDAVVEGACRRYDAGTSGSGNSEPAVIPDSNDEVPEIHPDAFHGLAGSIVKLIDPYTESDRKAILLHILVGFGNMIGDAPHAVVGAERHSARINAVLVGPTSAGRKGSAWRPIKEILGRSDGLWIKDRVSSGLSSGEGIIYHLRDAEGQDAGVSDKRLLAIEQEFASMLKVMSREGNSLSGVLRQAYDDGNLSTLTKNSPLKATRTHFSLIGHTTKEELLRYLDATEKANGFANRFLWFMVQRSKFLPDGEPIPENILDDLAGRMSEVIAWAKGDQCLKRDPLAAELWRNVYRRLNQDRPGMTGAILSRAAAQTLRLSLIYALLDQSPTIRIEHLKAALAVWDVSERSVLAIFGDRTGNPEADKILDALKEHPDGMTGEEIRDLFSRHRTREKDRALQMLIRIGRITPEQKKTGGAPLTSYRLATKAI